MYGKVVVVRSPPIEGHFYEVLCLPVIALFLLALILVLRLAPAHGQAAPGVVISQIYGAGGNTGATYKNDFIELFNASSSPVTLTDGRNSMPVPVAYWS
jgi:hypothetical protein